MTEAAMARHVPVLLQEVLDWLRPAAGRVYVDATLGLGGHSRAMLAASVPDGRVIGFEWDRQAVAIAGERLASFGERIQIVPASYTEMPAVLHHLGIQATDGLLADLGLSSLQLDLAERGFCFHSDAPLDMRMDRRRPLNAAQLLAEASESQLAALLYYYGEERQARRIASHLVQARELQAITTTKQLAALVAQAVPRRYHPKRVHVATQTFQALRIAVNGELDNVRALLTLAPQVLKPGGRMAIIAFHSLEDRLVKRAMEQDPRLQPLCKKPVTPGPEELAANPRSRSARMRIARRLE